MTGVQTCALPICDHRLGDPVGVRHQAQRLQLLAFDLDHRLVRGLASVEELVRELFVEGTGDEARDDEDGNHRQDEQDQDVGRDDLAGDGPGDDLLDEVVHAAWETPQACEARRSWCRKGKDLVVSFGSWQGFGHVTPLRG